MREETSIYYERADPAPSLTDFVECFWTVWNRSGADREFTILPDGYFDVLLRSHHPGSHARAMTGLWTRPVACLVPAGARALAVSFKALAAEYVFGNPIRFLLDEEGRLPEGSEGLFPVEAVDFQSFVLEVSRRLAARLAGKDIDERKSTLFPLLYTSQGTLSVGEMAASVFWHPRQINRYFNKWFGIPLKSFASILRYRASFDRIHDHDLSGNLSYADQAHFIREVKRYSGVTPGELADNKKDRFIQLETLHRK